MNLQAFHRNISINLRQIGVNRNQNPRYDRRGYLLFFEEIKRPYLEVAGNFTLLATPKFASESRESIDSP